MTVFALFVFTILLVKLVNVGRHVDDKIRMQNAADAGAYSGGVVMARGMNTLAFTNHLEAEVFALTAYMRTAQMRERDGKPTVESLTPDVLAKWEEVGKVFQQYGGQAGYTKFEKLGRAIEGKVPLERDVVSGFSEMSARHAEFTLPVLEYILHAGEGNAPGAGGGSFGNLVNVPDGGIIPRFQRALIRSVPQVANLTSNELALRYGRSGERLRTSRKPMQGRMWRTDAVAFIAADESDPLTRTVPAIDPSPTGSDGPPGRQYYDLARKQRAALAKHYLELWIRDWMGPYFAYAGQNRPGRSTAKMSQFINLWRTFACGHLKVLLDLEYPNTNLPHVIRMASGSTDANSSLVRDFHYVNVAYWNHIDEMFPGLFKNRLQRDGNSDAQTFAQVAVFLPRNRHLCCPWAWPYRVRVRNPDGSYRWETRWRNNMEGWPQHWDLLNQNWTCKLVPATADALPAILQQTPNDLPNFRPPRFRGVNPEDFRRLNRH